MKETCEFEKWLEQIEEKIKELPVEEKLEIIAEEIYSRYDARVWFSEISGKRWSYIAGWGGCDPTPSIKFFFLSLWHDHRRREDSRGRKRSSSLFY